MESVMASILAAGRARTVIATDGANGCYVMDSEDLRHYPAVEPPAAVVDSNGAGDAFVSGYLHRWLAGAPLAESVAAGLVAGALACTTPGVIPGEMWDNRLGAGPR
jgi:sugar/nucleoside kinase (ribokinase family)